MYRSADRVFWVIDNGSSHRGAASVRRLAGAHANRVPVHAPVHSSWLNQVEVYGMDLGTMDRMGVELDRSVDASERLAAFRPVRTVSGKSSHIDDRSRSNEISALLSSGEPPRPHGR